MKTIVYVDGFNLYYGALKGKPYKWLDLAALAQRLLPPNQIEHIHYCTALVSARAHDPQQPQRQQLYLRALKTTPNLTITYGHFLTQAARMRLAKTQPGQSPYATVLKTEEKGSDVNLASLMLRDGFQDRYDVAVLISNDSDLLLPIQIIRDELGKKVGVLNPYKKPSNVLRKNCDFYKPIRKGVLGASQFPATLSDGQGSFSKPADW